MDSVALLEIVRQQHQHIHGSRPAVSGRLVRVVGLTLEATGCSAAIGQACLVDSARGQIMAEVVGFAQERVFLMPQEDIEGVVPGARVTPLLHYKGVPLSMALVRQAKLETSCRVQVPVG